MSAEIKPAVPAAAPAKPRKRPAPPPRQQSSMAVVAIILGAVILAIGLVAGLHYLLVSNEPAKPMLADEFRDQSNEYADFAFSPPRYWKIDDRTQKNAYLVQGPGSSEFRPLMVFTSETAPGKLPDYIDEYKKRLLIEAPSVKFLSEEDDVIDGCRAKRIVYDSEFQDDRPNAPVVKLRNLQYIIKDPSYPEFYKITCSARTKDYLENAPTFEASAHTFRRMEIKANPKYFPIGK